VCVWGGEMMPFICSFRNTHRETERRERQRVCWEEEGGTGVASDGSREGAWDPIQHRRGFNETQC